MLIGIGKKPEAQDVVDLLLDCHTRIRSFSSLAVRIATAEGASADEVRQAAYKVRRYFTVALPRHVADEEESVLPRLMGRDPEVDQALQRMEDEHQGHEAPLRRLMEICEILSETPERLPSFRQELATTGARLEAEFQSHLDAEEQFILPAMRSLLSKEDLDAIHQELRQRRADLS